MWDKEHLRLFNLDHTQRGSKVLWAAKMGGITQTWCMGTSWLDAGGFIKYGNPTWPEGIEAFSWALLKCLNHSSWGISALCWDVLGIQLLGPSIFVAISKNGTCWSRIHQHPTGWVAQPPADISFRLVISLRSCGVDGLAFPGHMTQWMEYGSCRSPICLKQCYQLPACIFRTTMMRSEVCRRGAQRFAIAQCFRQWLSNSSVGKASEAGLASEPESKPKFSQTPNDGNISQWLDWNIFQIKWQDRNISQWFGTKKAAHGAFIHPFERQLRHRRFWSFFGYPPRIWEADIMKDPRQIIYALSPGGTRPV